MLLIKKAKVICENSAYNNKQVDILIKDGRISEIGTGLKFEGRTLELPNLHVSLGWFDAFAQVGEPGLEQRETFESFQKAASAGGFTRVGVVPNTKPALHSKTELRYVIESNQQSAVRLMPYGALTKNCEGKDFAEIYDLEHAGALAFTDGKQGIADSGLMLRSLQYVKPFKGLVMQTPQCKSLTSHGQMHEGECSTRLGTPGIPSIAETTIVERDLQLLQYAESRLHFNHISTAESVEIIRKAKAAGQAVTASVAVLNLLFTDAAIGNFDVNFKVLPPLRSQTDRAALIEGLKDGTIDFIDSNHIPLEIEEKECEFSYAGFGAINLQTAFSVALEALSPSFNLEELVACFTTRPAKVMGLPIGTFAEGEPAELTFFNPEQGYTFSQALNQSKSKNSPLFGRQMQGQVYGIFNNNQLIINK
jgi:dihydroorotase